nr:hypothetical protein [candidate division Zixibacteria bacterium]
MIAILFLAGCSGGTGGDSPKDTVVRLFGAMERNDAPAIEHLVDLPALMDQTQEDYALQRDEPRVFHNPAEILDDLTGDGITKKRWFSMQRVIGKTEIHGDSALVEVSFLNKKLGIQYYNKFGLRHVDGRWLIYSFRTMSGN